jgi:hypothetical protein
MTQLCSRNPCTKRAVIIIILPITETQVACCEDHFDTVDFILRECLNLAFPYRKHEIDEQENPNAERN